MEKFLDLFLSQRMNSLEGESLKVSLEQAIAEEKRCIDQFKIQIDYCKKQIKILDESLASGRVSCDLAIKKNAFEKEQVILNVAAQCQLCSFEIKEKQCQLYFEKDKHQRARLSAEAYVMMYERCNDMQQLTGKEFQVLLKQLLCQADLGKIRSALKNLSEFYRREKSYMSDVRNNVGAHRDHDFMRQMEILEGISWADTIDRLHRFEVVILEFGQSLKPLMDAGLIQIKKAFEEH